MNIFFPVPSQVKIDAIAIVPNQNPWEARRWAHTKCMLVSRMVSDEIARWGEWKECEV